MDRFENLIETYKDAVYPVAVADRELNVLWSNRKARGLGEIGETLGGIIKTSVEEGGTGIVFREGTMHTGSCISAAEVGEYIVLVWTRYAGSSNMFDADGVDAVMQAVRGGVHNIAIAADALEMDDPVTKTGAISAIKRGGYNVLRACEHMTVISRFFTGTLQPKKQNVNIKDLVYALVESTKSIADRRLDIRLVLPDGDVNAMVDIKLLERAVLNLLLNAVVHGGSDAHITVKLGCEAGRVIVSVSDDGPGMEGDALASAMEPYFSVRPGMEGPLARAGSGMGLTVAHICAAVHDGMLMLSSKAGSGTTANLVLPQGEPVGEGLRCTVGSYVANRFTNLYVEMAEVAVMPE